MDYAYTIRGWLKGINEVDNLNPTANENDLFSFKLAYNKPEESVSPLYNGNISEVYWKTANDNIKRPYYYFYDNLNRLAVAGDGNTTFDEGLDYDKNGNIMKLVRSGLLNANDNTSKTIDDLIYHYKENSNLLLKVVDETVDTQGFKDDGVRNTSSGEIEDPTDDYVYDAFGNITKDENKKIIYISYNHLNQPVNINFQGQSFLAPGNQIVYLYNALGQKVSKKIMNRNPFMAPIDEDTYYMQGGFQYSSHSLDYPAPRLDFIPHAEGSYNYLNKKYIFNYKDHLGNVRLSYSDTDGDGQLGEERIVNCDATGNCTDYFTSSILEENNYYPMGTVHQGYNTNVNSNNSSLKYRFNNKEYQDELGLNMYAMDYRQYDPVIGRFTTLDLFAEIANNKTPYHFASNNPLNRIDPTGLTDYQVNGETRTIEDGHDNLTLKVTEKDYDRLQKKFNRGGSAYYRMLNRLSDKLGFTTTKVTITQDIFNGPSLNIESTFHKAGSGTYGQWTIGENHQMYADVERIERSSMAALDGVTGQFKNINIGSNGSLYLRNNNGRIFNGNRYVSVTSAASKYSTLAKGAKVGGLVTGVLLGSYEVYQGYQQDGQEIGYNTQVQAAGAVGGIGGGMLGADIGAKIGAGIGLWFGGVGAVPGAIIGGLIGGAIGAWSGDYYGEKLAKEIAK